MSRRAEVLITTPPPLHLDGLVWPRFADTGAHLASAIELVADANTSMGFGATRPRVYQRAEDGTMLANIFASEKTRIAHSWIRVDDPSPLLQIRVELNAEIDGQRIILSLIASRSHAPLPIDHNRHGDHDQVSFILAAFRKAIRFALNNTEHVTPAVPDHMRLIATGAAVDMLQRRKVPLEMGPLGIGPTFCAIGETDLASRRLAIQTDDTSIVIHDDSITALPALLRMDADSNPDGPVTIHAKLMCQNIWMKFGDCIDPMIRLRALKAWNDRMNPNTSAPA